MKLFKEVIKNLKIILRSWTSMTLLVLGPLLLILIIGYTFSNSIPHDITIGMYGEDGIDVDLLEKIEEVGKVQQYSNTALCLRNLKEHKVNLCLEVQQPTETNGELTSALFIFYYNDANKKMSQLLIANINELIGEKSSEISVQTTRTILDEIQEMVFYINSKRDTVNTAENELADIRTALVIRRVHLQNISNEFTPRYNQIKNAQIQLDEQITRLEEENVNIEEQIEEIEEILEQLNTLITTPTITDVTVTDPLNITSFNIVGNTLAIIYDETELYKYDLTNTTIEEQALLYTALLTNAVGELQNSLNLQDTEYTFQYENIREIKTYIDEIITQLDAMKQLLDEEIAFTTEGIEKINLSIEEIQKATTDIDERLEGLGTLNPALAEVIINPILKEYRPAIEFRNIETVYPGLLVIVIVFVTLLFSNILTLSEINAEAYFRNTISPVTPLLMPAGVFLSTYVLVMFQVTILLLIGQYWFKVQLLPVLLQTYVLASLLIFVFTLIGMILAYLIKTQEISVLTTTFVALGVYLFSSIVTPLELMPIIASKIAAFNPVVLGEVMFKKLLLYQIPLFYSIEALLTIIIYILILTIITLFLNNKMHDSQ